MEAVPGPAGRRERLGLRLLPGGSRGSLRVIPSHTNRQTQTRHDTTHKHTKTKQTQHKHKHSPWRLLWDNLPREPGQSLPLEVSRDVRVWLLGTRAGLGVPGEGWAR